MNLLQDLLGLFKRNKFVSAPKLNDFIPIGVDKGKAPGIESAQKPELGIVRLSKIKALIASGSTEMGGTMTSSIIPDTNDAYDIGSAEKKIRDLYVSDSTIYVGDAHIKSSGERIVVSELQTGDLHLTNEIRGGNSIDGSWGNWTFQEGSDDLFLLNNRNGKKYKFNLTEV